MATTVRVGYGFQFHKNIFGPTPGMIRVIAASNITIVFGAPLAVKAASSIGSTQNCPYVTMCGATSTSVYAVAAEGVTGVAATRQSLAAYPVVYGMLFKVQQMSTLNLTSAYMGLTKAKLFVSGTKFGIYAGGTTSVLQIHAIAPGGSPGTGADVIVSFVRSAYMGTKAVT